MARQPRLSARAGHDVDEYQADETLVETALAAFRDSAVSVVGTSGAGDPSGFEVPPNARVEALLPHGPIIERASCVVCHGGMGVTQKAIAGGVPVCVVPFGRDQLEVARRVELSGAGTQLSPMRLKPHRLRDAVFQAIEVQARRRAGRAGVRERRRSRPGGRCA